MKVISKKYPCTGAMQDGKPGITIDFTLGEVVENDEDDREWEGKANGIVQESLSEGITKLAQELAQNNEKTKSLKARILRVGQTGFITLKYLV